MQISPDMTSKIVQVEKVALLLTDGPLGYGVRHAAAIATEFAAAQAGNPHLFNGGFFLFSRPRVEVGRFRAEATATDYATFLHWRNSGWPDVGLAHIFPVGAVVTRDRRLLLGRMGATTVNAGRFYPPSGSFDPSDLTCDGRIDPLANILREIGEEVGIAADGWPRRDDWLVIPHGPRIALVSVIEAPFDSSDLDAEIQAHLGGEAIPELGGFEFRAFDQPLPAEQTVGYVNALLAHLHDS